MVALYSSIMYDSVVARQEEIQPFAPGSPMARRLQKKERDMLATWPLADTTGDTENTENSETNETNETNEAAALRTEAEEKTMTPLQPAHNSTAAGDGSKLTAAAAGQQLKQRHSSRHKRD